MTWPQYRRQQCSIGDFIIELSPLETDLLSVLLIRYPNSVTVEELIEFIYLNPDAEPDWAAEIVTRGMRSLGRKIGAFRVEVGRFMGYRLCQVPTDASKAA